VALALVIRATIPARRLAARRCGCLVTVLIALIIAGVLLGGKQLLAGNQPDDPGPGRRRRVPPRCVWFRDALSWTGVIIVLAICGVVASWISHPLRGTASDMACSWWLTCRRAAGATRAGSSAHAWMR